jgi:aromatic-amino-acid transaminase
VGLLSIRGQSADDCARVISQVKQAIRSLYSNPPKHGAALVRHILSTSALREIWEEELTQMRARIQEMRLGLAEGLSLACPQHDFSFLRSQQGMFSFTGLTGPSVDRLRKEYSIFMTRNGRMNVAGLNPDNLDYVVHAFSQVLGS